MPSWINGNLQGRLSPGQGEPGKSLEYMWRGTELGIRQEGEEEYQFVDLAPKLGAVAGREIELQVENGYLQWRYKEEEWNNLISIDSLKGGKGDKGEQGERGPQGEQGPKGETGPQGPIGEQGPQGIPGRDGVNGKDGKNGLDGTNGQNGEDGVTPNITIGTVTTLEPGEQATVVNSGTKENPIFDFGIPQGKSGSDGVNGATPDMSDFENKINKQYETIEKKVDDHIVNHPEGGGSGVAKSDKVDYMGKQHDSLKETNDSNVEYLLRKLNTQKYEGSSITANNTYAKQVNNVILKGVTKYRDIDTGDFIESFEEGRNLELVGSKGNTILIKNKLNLKDLIYISSVNNMKYTINNNSMDLSNRTRWGRVIFNFEYQAGVVYNITFVSNIEGSFCIDFNRDGNNRTRFSKEAVSKDFTPSGNQPLQICNLNTGGMQLSDFYICESRYKNEPYKSSQLILPIENPLYSIGDICDYIDLNTGIYVRNIGIRAYQEGDESNDQVLTDKNNTIYKLEEPVVSKIDLQGQKVYSYDGTTYYNCQSEVGYPAPILSIEVPTDLASLVSSQKAEIKSLNEENKIQDELINTTMLATDEMYMMLEPLLAETLSERSVSKMVDMYVAMVQRGIKTIEQVPIRYREQVKKILDQLEK